MSRGSIPSEVWPKKAPREALISADSSVAYKFLEYILAGTGMDYADTDGFPWRVYTSPGKSDDVAKALNDLGISPFNVEEVDDEKFCTCAEADCLDDHPWGAMSVYEGDVMTLATKIATKEAL